MNKALVIHVISEAVVILLAIIVLQKQIGNIKKEVTLLNDTVKKQEQQLSKCMFHIQQLYDIISPSQRSFISQAPPSSLVGKQRMMQEEQENFAAPPPQMQQMQQQMSSQMMMNTPQMIPQMPQMPQMPQKVNNMMSDIMNLVPAIMPLMTGNQANVIIAELEKPPVKDAAASVEVMDDEDDPDVDEALNPSSVEEEKFIEQKEN